MKLEQMLEQLNPANRKLAEVLLMQLAQQQGLQFNGEVELPPPIDSIPLWVVAMKNVGGSPRTIVMYEYEVRNYLKNDPVPTTLSVQAWVAKRLESVSPSTVNTTLKALKSLFKYLTEYGLWDINPVARLGLVKETTKEVECPSNEAILKLFDYKLTRKKDDQKFKTMLFMLVNTGLRITEACSIRRTLINLATHEVKVLGKGNKERSVPISGYVAALLETYIEQNPTESPYLFDSDAKRGYWSDSGFRKELAHACKKLGIKHIRPHQLRHYFATRTLEHGAKLDVISRILGHESVGITAKTYRHIQSKEFHEEHDKHDPLKQLSAERPMLPAGKKEVIEGEYTEITK